MDVIPYHNDLSYNIHPPNNADTAGLNEFRIKYTVVLAFYRGPMQIKPTVKHKTKPCPALVRAIVSWVQTRNRHQGYLQ